MAVYSSAAAISAVAIVVGAATCRQLGVSSWVAPPVGLSTCMLIALAGLRLPGHVWTALAALASAVIVSAVVLLRGGLGARAAVDALLVAVVLLVACSVPFITYDRIGELGPGFSSDLVFHLGQAEELREIGPAANVAPAGYPTGPHALVATVSQALDVDVSDAFLGLLLAVPVLTGVAALAVFEDLPRGRRLIGAALVGLPYLPAFYFVEGSFKEPITALCILGIALTVRHAMRPGRVSAGAILAGALCSAGGVAALGWPALAWPAATLVVLAALLAITGRVPTVHLRINRRFTVAASVVVVTAGALALAIAASGFFDSSGAGKYFSAKGAGGNFSRQLSPLEATGIWPLKDFREQPDSYLSLRGLLIVIGLAAVLYGMVWAWRRSELALLAAAVGGMLVYAVALPVTLAYNTGKALAVVAPVLSLISLCALFESWPVQSRRPGP
jgi:hypothetical protein